MSMEQKTPRETERELSLRLSILKKTLELMTSAFALVAALAWNDAIQSLFLKIFGPTSSLIAKFIYALLITAVVVIVAVRLSRLSRLIDAPSSSNHS